eukprot:jgi/Bigna1/84950/estExt_fgenesh1_pg.C_10451
MGNETSSPEARYKKELLKLSWRLVLTVQEQAASEIASKDLSRVSDVSQNTEAKAEAKFKVPGQDVIRPFHEDFMEQFFKYCPDLKSKFPSNYTLVSKMIQSFVSNAIVGSDLHRLYRKYGKSHIKYDLTADHFQVMKFSQTCSEVKLSPIFGLTAQIKSKQGFSGALVDTIQSRLGKFGTIELIRIWRLTTDAIVKGMEKEYLKAKKRGK